MFDGVTKLIDDTNRFVPRLPEVLLAFVIGYLVIQLLVWLLTRGAALLRLPKALTLILKSLASLVLWVALISYLLSMVGLSQLAATLSGSLLVFGFAIANGANALVSDVISGIFLAKDPDFNIGYHIKSGEREGVIESIDIRKTRVRTSKDTLLVIPNAAIDKDHWEVLSRHNNAKRA